MNPQDRLRELADNLDRVVTDEGLVFQTEIVSGEVDILVLTVEDREEFPIYITVDEGQILCITHLWKESEINSDKRLDLLDTLISMNVSIPLSAFSKVGSQYIIFGALSVRSTMESMIEEICALSDNTLAILEELKDYLR